ncbi:MAG: hypothetical protein RLZZ519_2476, partial [Bacteroidota bacterium]
PDVVEVQRFHIKMLDQPLFFEFGEGQRIIAGRVGNMGFDLGNGTRKARPAEVAFDLEAVVLRRIVACGDDDPGADLALGDRERHHRRAHKTLSDKYLNAMARQNAGYLVGKQGSIEPAIIADHDAGLGISGIEPNRHAFGDTGEVLDRETLRDDGSPAIRAKFDGLHTHFLIGKWANYAFWRGMGMLI